MGLRADFGTKLDILQLGLGNGAQSVMDLFRSALKQYAVAAKFFLSSTFCISDFLITFRTAILIQIARLW